MTTKKTKKKTTNKKSTIKTTKYKKPVSEMETLYESKDVDSFMLCSNNDALSYSLDVDVQKYNDKVYADGNFNLTVGTPGTEPDIKINLHTWSPKRAREMVTNLDEVFTILEMFRTELELMAGYDNSDLDKDDNEDPIDW